MKRVWPWERIRSTGHPFSPRHRSLRSSGGRKLRKKGATAGISGDTDATGSNSLPREYLVNTFQMRMKVANGIPKPHRRASASSCHTTIKPNERGSLPLARCTGFAQRDVPREATLDQEGETDPKQRGGTDREDGGHYPGASEGGSGKEWGPPKAFGRGSGRETRLIKYAESYISSKGVIVRCFR